MDAGRAAIILLEADDEDFSSEYSSESESEDCCEEFVEVSSDNELGSDPTMSSSSRRLATLRKNYVWSTDIRIRNPSQFTGSPGPTPLFYQENADSPYDVFKLIFTDELFEVLVSETNRYARQEIAIMRDEGQLKPHSRKHDWVDVSRQELEVFLGLTLLTGVVNIRGTLESY